MSVGGLDAAALPGASDAAIQQEAWERLHAVYDPELGIDVASLGLIYDLRVDRGQAAVRMTLTTPGCPMSDSMPEAVRRTLELIPGVAGVTVDLVFEPPWEPEMMSEPARQALGWR